MQEKLEKLIIKGFKQASFKCNLVFSKTSAHFSMLQMFYHTGYILWHPSHHVKNYARHDCPNTQKKVILMKLTTTCKKSTTIFLTKKKRCLNKLFFILIRWA